jgi:hypothetical protein
MTDATIKDVADYFKTGEASRDTLSQFAKEWKELSEASKAQIRTGVGDESLTY